MEREGKKRRRKAVNEKLSKNDGKAYTMYAMGNMAAPRLMFSFHFFPHTYTFLMHASIFYWSFLYVCVNKRDL